MIRKFPGYVALKICYLMCNEINSLPMYSSLTNTNEKYDSLLKSLFVSPKMQSKVCKTLCDLRTTRKGSGARN